MTTVSAFAKRVGSDVNILGCAVMKGNAQQVIAGFASGNI